MVLARCVQYRQIWRRTDHVITSEIFCRKQFPACRGCVVRCGTCSWDRTEANDFPSVLLGRIAKHGVQRCGLLLPMFRGLCVSLLVTTMSCVKTAEPIEMLFAMWTRVDLRNHVWGAWIPGKGQFWGDDTLRCGLSSKFLNERPFQSYFSCRHLRYLLFGYIAPSLWSSESNSLHWFWWGKTNNTESLLYPGGL